MKKLLFVAMVAMVGVVNAEMKIGTVDMLKLVRNHSSYEPNKTLLKETEKDYQKKIDKMREDLEAIQEEGKKKAEQMRQPMLSENAKAKLEKELIDMQTRIINGQQRLRSEAMRSQQDLQDLEARLLKATSTDLRKRITEFAEKNGYDFVLDASAAPFKKAQYDVTPELLKAMGVDPATAKEVSDSDRDKDAQKKQDESK